MAKKIKIELSENEVTLLMSILKDAYEDRADMGCNDPVKKEEKLFSKKERINIMNTYLSDEFSKEDIKDLDGFMFNSNYVMFIIKRIKEQVK